MLFETSHSYYHCCSTLYLHKCTAITELSFPDITYRSVILHGRSVECFQEKLT